MNTLTIDKAHISQDSEGRYCLNDLHRAAGGARRHGPSLWLDNRQTKELVAEIAHELGDTGIPVSVIRGGVNQGSYVCRELVYAYAMWISPRFHLKVIRAYDAIVAAELERMSGLQYRMVRAELDLSEGQGYASRCGSGLSRWRYEGPELERRVEVLRNEMQPMLPLFH